MIILKHNGAVYIAKSSFALREEIFMPTKSDVKDEEHIGIWHPGGQTDRLIAAVRLSRFSDAVFYEDTFPSSLDAKHLVLETYESLLALCREREFGDGSALPTRMIFAEGDRAFILNHDGAQMEIEDIYVDSIFDGEAKAFYDSCVCKDPYRFLGEVYRMVEKMFTVIMFPVVVLNTKSNEIKILER